MKNLLTKPAIYIYGITLSLLSKYLFMYIFTIILYKQDRTGISASFTVVLGLIAVSLSGIIAPILLKRFKGHLLGMILVVSSVLIIIVNSFIEPQKPIIYSSILLLFLIQGIESANYNYEVTSVLEVGTKLQVTTNNTFHILVELFSMLAPLIWYGLVNYLSLYTSLGIIIMIQIFPGWAWLRLKPYENEMDLTHLNPSVSILKTYKKVLKNKGVVYLNLVRTFNGFIFNIWSITVPLIIAKVSMSTLEPVSYMQTIYEALGSISFIVSGIFLGRFLQSLRFLSVFYRAVPYAGALGVIIALLYKSAYSLYLATVILGISIYFFRVGTATIGQMITDKSLIAESIVLGDVFSRLVNFVTTSIFFILIHWINYEIVVIIFTIVGTLGNMLFVQLPLTNYGKRLSIKKAP